MSFLDKLFLTGVAKQIETPTQLIDINTSEPALNKVLKITSMSPPRGTWETESGGGGAVASVFGRAGVVVATLGDYLASLVSNDSGVPGSTVKDALNVLAAAIPSVPVSSVFGRVGAITATLGDYVASKVTNDSAVSGATTKDALNTLGTALSSYVSPYILVPASPNAFDDEFDTGGDDLAVRGFTVTDGGGTTLTRSGGISPWDTSGPVGNTYWSTRIGSWMFIQGRPGQTISIHKTITLAAGDTYFARTSGTHHLNQGSFNRQTEVDLLGASGAAHDYNNRVFLSVHSDVGNDFLRYDAGGIVGGVFNGFGGHDALGGHDIRGIHFGSGTSYDAFVVDGASGEPKSLNVVGPISSVLVRAAAQTVFENTVSGVPQIWGIDFFRKKESNAWLIP